MSLPDFGAKQQISRDGGSRPRWSSTGEALFFLQGAWTSPGRMMMARRVAGQQSFAWQDPMPLFDVPRVEQFDVARDGRSIYFVAPNPEGPAREINVVVNWLQESLRN